MTDAQAISQINDDITETEAVRQEVIDAHTQVDAARNEVSSELQTYNNKGSVRSTGLSYVQNHFKD